MHIRIGSRGSKLALWQSHYVASRLQTQFPSVTFEIKVIKTTGDKIQDVSLQKLGDKGIFVKEIEEQLLSGEIDMAVHSMKDMPAVLPSTLIFSMTWKREDARDALILKDASSLLELKEGAIIGTGSVRRAAQIKKLRPDVIIRDIRGNVETRLRKLHAENYDGIILAVAGLKRVGLESEITEYFSYDEMVPACAQGALGIELRKEQMELREMLDKLSDEIDHQCVEAERLFLEKMAGNCHIPMGGFCEKKGTEFIFRGMYGSMKKGEEVIRNYNGHGKNPIELALEAVKILKES